MELRQLRYFLAVGELEHFGRAAASLRIAQPALSRQIRQLEQELNVELFERLPRGVRLSDAGRMLLPEAARILHDVQSLAETARVIGRGDTGKLKIGVAESASSQSTMVNGLMEFRAAFPKVTLELQHMTSLVQLEAVTSRTIDAGFIYHMPEGRPDLARLQVEHTRILLAVPDTHPLAQRSEVRLRDVGDAPMVWIRRAAAPATYDLTMRACLGAGLSPSVVQEATSESIALSLVSVGGLLSFVTDTNRERCPGNVVLREVADLDLYFTLNLIWRQADTSPALGRFVEIVEKTAQRLGIATAPPA